jgi:hypothetical protein
MASDYPFWYLRFMASDYPFWYLRFTVSDYPFWYLRFTASDYPFWYLRFTASDYPGPSGIFKRFWIIFSSMEHDKNGKKIGDPNNLMVVWSK